MKVDHKLDRPTGDLLSRYDPATLPPELTRYVASREGYDYQHHAWVPGWGNEELQYYTRERENAFVRDSVLHIRALLSSPDMPSDLRKRPPGAGEGVLDWSPGRGT